MVSDGRAQSDWMYKFALGGLALFLIGAAPVQSANQPQSPAKTATAPAKPKLDSGQSATVCVGESNAADCVANRIAERANLIAEAQRSYAFLQLILGGFGVVFTGAAAFFAYRATHWAKEAAKAARKSAVADNETLEGTRRSLEISEMTLKIAQRPFIRAHQFVFDLEGGSGKVVVINEGSTAGRVVGSEVFSYYGESLPQEHLVRKHDRENALKPDRIIRSGEVFEWTFKSAGPSQGEKLRIENANDRFSAYIVGRIVYIDELDSEHHMLFCRKLDKNIWRYLDVGDPDYSRDG